MRELDLKELELAFSKNSQKKLLLLLLVYITRSSGRAWESWENCGYKIFIYCQYNKAEWKNLGTFFKLLGPMNGHLLFLSF